MKISIIVSLLAALAASSSFAQAPAGAPAGSTGLCKDGTYSDNATKRGACSGHKGVKTWYAAEADGAAPVDTRTSAKVGAPVAPSVPASTATAPNAMAPTAMTPNPSAPNAPARAAATATREAAAGGGAGQVWVNSGSKVYHCQGTKYYGTTKQGSYMTEAAAKAAGNHADHGKACTS